MADGWRCPECGLIMAPSVTFHRCDPPAAGVTTTTFTPGGAPSSGTISLTPPGGAVWTINVSGLVMDEKALTETVQRNLVRQSAAWRLRAV